MGKKVSKIAKIILGILFLGMTIAVVYLRLKHAYSNLYTLLFLAALTFNYYLTCHLIDRTTPDWTILNRRWTKRAWFHISASLNWRFFACWAYGSLVLTYSHNKSCGFIAQSTLRGGHHRHKNRQRYCPLIYYCHVCQYCRQGKRTQPWRWNDQVYESNTRSPSLYPTVSLSVCCCFCLCVHTNTVDFYADYIIVNCYHQNICRRVLQD